MRPDTVTEKTRNAIGDIPVAAAAPDFGWSLGVVVLKNPVAEKLLLQADSSNRTGVYGTNFLVAWALYRSARRVSFSPASQLSSSSWKWHVQRRRVRRWHAYRADKGVISSIHVKHLIDMAPRELFGDAVLDGVSPMQSDLAMSQFHFAFTQGPEHALASGGANASWKALLMENPASTFTLTPDDVRVELNIADYPLQVCHPSVFDMSRVPAGQGLLKIEGCMPYKIQGRTVTRACNQGSGCRRCLTALHALHDQPDKRQATASYLLSHLDMERMNPSMWRGSAHHFDNRGGNFAPCPLDIPGLYQTGACMAPGGSIVGLPGCNTTQAVLQEGAS